MNQIIASLILAIVQGTAEWLPISSSGHLILVSKLIGFPNDFTFFVALHFGTLMAIFVYFSRDIVDIIESLMKRQWKSENGKIGILLIIAVIPAGLFGILFHYFVPENNDNLFLLSLGFAITAVVLFIGAVDFNKGRKIHIGELGYKRALLIGLAQVLSLFRGISRSGTTISSGLLLGLSEKNAVKFSFLLSIPIVLGANLLEIGSNRLPSSFLWATLVSFAVGILTIHLSFTYVLNNKKNLRWLGAYVALLTISIWIWLIFN